MTTSDFPGGITSFGQLVIGLPSAGNTFWVDPDHGDDSFDGLTPQTAYASLAKALSVATANQNDVIYLLSSTNAASPTTNRVAVGGLAWNKDSVHLIGVSSGTHTQQRARISTLTTDTATSIVLNISANNCLFSGVSVFHGVDGWVGTGGVPPTAVKVTGSRNHFKGFTMSGLGDATGANSMDVALGSSLWLSAASENYFEDCYIGLETVFLGNTTAGAIYMDGACSRNLFRGCIVSTRASHVNHRQVRVAAAALQDMGAYFVNTQFTNSGIFTGGAAADGMIVAGAGCNGGVFINGSSCGAIGFSFWEKAAVSGFVYVSNPAVGAGKAGLGTVAVGA